MYILCKIYDSLPRHAKEETLFLPIQHTRLTGHMSLEDFELAHPSNSLARPARLDGYPSFAHFIARDADAAIYRKYAHLSARNLLYLQSELHELEQRLQRLDEEDAKHIDDERAQKAARYWKHYSDPDNARACQHKILQEKIRLKLKEYRAYKT